MTGNPDAERDERSRQRTERVWRASTDLGAMLEQHGELNQYALRRAMAAATDPASGEEWTWDEAYDAAETAINRRILAADDTGLVLFSGHNPGIGSPAAGAPSSDAAGSSTGASDRDGGAQRGGRGTAATAAARRLARQESTQTLRGQATNGRQQFSTPLVVAIAVIKAAGIRPDDRIVEPSAGTGVLAVLAAAALDEAKGGELIVNEIDSYRAQLLRRLLGSRTVMNEDAEQLGGLRPELRPSLILMNPPFTSRRPNGTTRRHADLAHLAAAYAMVRPGGRVVAVTSAACEPDGDRWVRTFGNDAGAPSLAASIELDGKLFHSRGTQVRTRLTVIDRGQRGPREAAAPATAYTGPALWRLAEEVDGRLD